MKIKIKKMIMRKSKSKIRTQSAGLPLSSSRVEFRLTSRLATCGHSLQTSIPESRDPVLLLILILLLILFVILIFILILLSLFLLYLGLDAI